MVAGPPMTTWTRLRSGPPHRTATVRFGGEVMIMRDLLFFGGATAIGLTAYGILGGELILLAPASLLAGVTVTLWIAYPH
jgi:hypothetical protein